MSIMRLLLFLIIFLVHRCSSTDDSIFQIQPQPVRINHLDEIYITRDDHYIGQVLYQYDQIELACECQTQSNIYWTINDQIFHRYNNSKSIELLINRNTVQTPITYVTCYCIFIQSNLTQIKKDYQYQLYIDLESEPSLKPIYYFVQSSILKQRFYSFIKHHSIIILSFGLIVTGITCLLIILSFNTSH